MKRLFVLFAFCAVIACSMCSSVNAEDLDDFVFSAPEDAHYYENVLNIATERYFGSTSSNPAFTTFTTEQVQFSSDCQMFAYLSNGYINAGLIIPDDSGAINADSIKPFNTGVNNLENACKYRTVDAKTLSSGVVKTTLWHKDLGESSFNLYSSIQFRNSDNSDGMYYCDGFLFESLDAAKAYYTNGSKDGLLQEPAPTPPSSPNGLYDSSLPGVSNLSLRSLGTNYCHDASNPVGYTMCVGLKWDKPSNVKSGDFYKIKVFLKYNYNTYWSTKRSYSSGSFFCSDLNNGKDICISDCGFDICAVDVAKVVNVNLVNSSDRVSSFTIEDVQKVLIMPCRYVDGVLYHGDWYSYNVDKNKGLSPNFNEQEIGSGEVIQGDIYPDPDGNFPEGTEHKQQIPKPETSNNENIFGGIDFTDVTGVLSGFYSILKNLMGALGAFPSLFAAVFVFLPYEVYTSIILLFYIAIIIGLLKIFT